MLTNQDDIEEKIYKIIVIGANNAGKTSLMYRYNNGTILVDPECTLGLKIFEKKIEVDGSEIILNIWDTAGQERFRAIISPFYRYADAAILVYDVTERRTFEELDYWLQECEKHDIDKQAPKILIGNKCDRKYFKSVHSEEAKAFADQHNLPFYETSSRMNSDIEEIMDELLRKTVEYKSLKEEYCWIENSKTIKLHKTKRSSNCCMGRRILRNFSF